MEDAINQTKVSQQCSPPHDRLYRLLTDVSPIKSERVAYIYPLPIDYDQVTEFNNNKKYMMASLFDKSLSTMTARCTRLRPWNQKVKNPPPILTKTYPPQK